MLKRNDKIIIQKMRQYILPGIMLTAALQIGNIVDTMLVGNLLGPEAMSAVKVGMAVDNIIEIPGYVLGVGGSVAAGIFMGNREIEKARKVFSSTLFISILFGLIFSIFSIWSGTYAQCLCGGSSLVEDARRFILVTLLISPILGVALQMINYVAVDNNPALASAYVITANVINLVMDYVLLKYSSLGTAGAALSTGLGYGIALLLLILYVKSDKRMLSIVNPFRDMAPHLLAALKAGTPTLLYMIFLTIKDMSMNTMIIRTVGESAMIIYTVCFNGMLCVQMFAGGIVGLLSNMGSVLYGKNDFYGIRVLIRRLLRYSYIAVGIFMLIMLVKPEIFLRLFGVTEAAVVTPGVTALRIYTFSLPFYLWNHFMMVYYQSTDKTVLSSIITSLQTCVAIVPLAYAFVFAADKIGIDALNALVISFIFSEIATLLITLIYQRIKYKNQNYFMIPKQQNDTAEFTVGNHSEQIAEALKYILIFCENHKVPESVMNRANIVAKDMLNSIFTNSGAQNTDVAINITDDLLRLQLTDDGTPYNPAESFQAENKSQIHKAEYLRVIDLNYTMIEMNIAN